MNPSTLAAPKPVWEHVIFLSGFLWLTLSVAARVVASHGGSMAILDGHRKKSLAYGTLILVAMISRVATDLWTGGRLMHLALASGFALIAMGLWGWIYLPLILPVARRRGS